MRGADFARIRLVLGRSAHFNRLQPAALDRLAALARLRHVPHGDRIGTAAARDEHLWIVVSGAVRISTHPRAGSPECVHAVLGAGSYFGLANAVRHGPFTFEARAFGATDLAVIDGERLFVILEQHPRLWRFVSGMLARRFKLALSVIEDNRVRPLPERAARRLLSHAMTSELMDGAQPELRMTQGDLARMLGAGRSRINTLLNRLQAQGLLVTGYRTIKLNDLARLRELAGDGVTAF